MMSENVYCATLKSPRIGAADSLLGVGGGVLAGDERVNCYNIYTHYTQAWTSTIGVTLDVFGFLCSVS